MKDQKISMKDNNSSGSVLIIVIIAIAVVSALTISMVSMTQSSTLTYVNLNSQNESLYLAEAGIDLAKKQIKDDTKSAGTYTVDGAGSFDISFSYDAPSDTYTITSTGKVTGQASRTITADYQPPGGVDPDPADNIVTITPPVDPVDNNGNPLGGVGVIIGTTPGTGSASPSVVKQAIWADEKIDLKGSASIDSYNSDNGNYAPSNSGSAGTVVTNSDKKDSVKLHGGTSIEGNVIVGNDAKNNAIDDKPNGIDGSEGELSNDVDLPIVSSPDFDDSIVWNVIPNNNGNDYHTSNAGGNITLGVAGETNYYQTTRDFKVNSWGNTLSIYGDTVIDIGGDFSVEAPSIKVYGNLVLNIEDDFTIQQNFIIEDGATLTVYVGGDRIDVKWGALLKTNASVPKPADIVIISTKDTGKDPKVELNGSVDVYGVIYAPQADVTLKGGAELFGAVVAKKITIKGNSAIHYDEALGSD